VSSGEEEDILSFKLDTKVSTTVEIFRDSSFTYDSITKSHNFIPHPEPDYSLALEAGQS
jgi:hypothetical protein